MKTNRIIIVIATAAYSYLFYRQSPGLNLAVFSALLCLLLALANRAVLTQYKWWLACGACMASAITAGFYGSELNVFVNLIGIAVVSYITLSRHLSVITGVVQTGFSCITALFIAGVHRLNRYIIGPQQGAVPETKSSYKWHYLVIPLCVIMLFVVLYRSASGAFAHLTSQIDFGFLAPEWLVFTLFGFILLYGLFVRPQELAFFNRETQSGNNISRSLKWMTTGFNYTGITLFVMLDILLLLVNITDISYLCITDTTGIDFDYASLIHQGVAALSFSLILAVGFILLWINQLPAGTRLYNRLRIAALLWLLCNMVLIGTNVYKNHLYISAYGLTHLRVGVYFFLFLAMLTLMFCWYKIAYHKNNWFLYRRFGLVLLVLTLGFNTVNWDRVIVKHNIYLYTCTGLYPDTEYLLNLSPGCLPQLHANWDLLNPSHNPYFNTRLNKQTENFCESFRQQDWRSRSITSYNTYNLLRYISPVNTNQPVRIQP